MGEQFDTDEILDLDEATKAAQDGFKIKYLFPWQRLVIANILDSAKAAEEETELTTNDDDEFFCRGRQIVLLPTGAGKSMCFLVPSMLLPGPTLVLYPLIALMADQMRRMNEAGIPCVIFKGGQTKEEREENFKLINETDSSKKAKVILANPEVLQDKDLVKRLSECRISHIAIDEAHCVSEWGDSFRPAYLTLGKIIKELNVKIVTAFTATASPPVLNRVGEVLFEGMYHLLQSASDRANIHYAVKYAYAKKKAALELSKTMRKPMIIFCGTRPRTEDMARLLTAYYGQGKAKFYHAGMTKEEKLAVEKWFFDSDDGILTATCAYGMGMDKGNIYSVVHLDAPEHLENFAQEAGRAGRKGDNVNSVLIWNHADYVRWRQAKPGSREKALGDFALNKNCRRQLMLDYLGGEETVCSGCDICDARQSGKKLNYEAEDAQFAFKFIKRNRRLYTREEAVQEVTQRLNSKYLDFYNIDVWETKDTAEIFTQLLSEKKLKICGSLWENRLDIVKTGRNGLKIIPRRLRHHLHRHRRHLRWIQERVQELQNFFS
ncbi:MAG: ATP-dependent DNA helicase RecQ [Treponema sp.]|nr:ATP-dependent DNA helicase RecQ [Candidatus Treponema equifaecale]